MSSRSQRPRFWSRSRTGSPPGPDRAAEPGGLQLHQRHQPVDLRLPGLELGQDAPQPQRILAELRPHPVVAGGGRVALVEDEVDDLEDGGEAVRQVGAAGQLEGHPRLRQGPLGPDDALGDGGLRDQEGARDLVGGEAAQQPQRQRHPRLHGEHRVAGDEDEAQEIVVAVSGRTGLGRRGDRSPPPRGRAPRACARPACPGAGGRWRGAWRWP